MYVPLVSSMSLVKASPSTEDCEAISGIPLKGLHGKDELIWAANKNGKYSVRSCYQMLSPHVENRQAWTRVWKLNLPPKMKTFFWQVCTDCLPSKERLLQRRVSVWPVCSTCGVDRESTLHVFQDCVLAKEVWWSQNKSFLQVGATTFAAWADAVKGRCSKEELEQFVLICWSLWKSRNDKLWKNISTFWRGVVARGETMLAGWKEARVQQSDWKASSGGERGGGDGTQGKWQPPGAGVVKINVDAAVHSHGDWRGLGLVARNDKGSFIAGRSVRERGRFSVSTTEALAIREAVLWAAQAGWAEVIIESDALSVVQRIADSDGISYEDNIFAEIRHMIARFANLNVHYVQ
ncbi:unnamed protein product [Cuscuta epithymum]|uniref:Reverse transcriptase zinc-binding domain-containing protein n=1 Tax=Cuscuta epithymum TaxID=186058 RepID=A0AAV0CT26_9ASTE|nr:unnamed protein product [Cuscuta epithymum]